MSNVVWIALCFAILLAGSPAAAKEQNLVPMNIVAGQVLVCHPGRILDARLQGARYAFKVLTSNSRVVTVFSNARTGLVACP